MTSVYTVRTAAPGVLSIIKLDGDWNPEASYFLTLTDDGKVTCTCPASDRPTCRHRKMLSLFIKEKHIDDGWFLEWEPRRWRMPIPEGVEAYNLEDLAPSELHALVGKAVGEAPEALPELKPEAITTFPERPKPFTGKQTIRMRKIT